jgi:transmembrane sensor
MKNNTDNLLAKYFGGNASEKDMQALEQWISMSAENQASFDELSKLYEKLGIAEVTIPELNTEKAKESFLTYMSIHENTKPIQVVEFKPKAFYKQWMFQAASIALILALSFSAWLVYSEHDVVLASRAILKERILSDHTQIKLSENSKITYSSNYGKKSRKIRLEGKAFFAIGHQGNGTLQIKAAETLIEDIGTQFTVSAYPESKNVSVIVSEGKVHFFTASNSGITLNANETGIYNKQTQKFTVIKPDTIAKEIKHIQFNGIALSSAMETISKQYGVTIRYAQHEISERSITVNFDGENVDMVLQVIGETLDLNVKKDANGYLLSNNKKSSAQ